MLSEIYANRESAKLTGILDVFSLSYAGLAQRQSECLVSTRSGSRNPYPAPIIYRMNSEGLRPTC